MILRPHVALLSQLTQLFERQLVERPLSMNACTGTDRTDADQDGGKGDDACVVNRHASSSKSHEDGTTEACIINPQGREAKGAVTARASASTPEHGVGLRRFGQGHVLSSGLSDSHERLASVTRGRGSGKIGPYVGFNVVRPDASATTTSPNYDVTALLGEGGMGQVIEA